MKNDASKIFYETLLVGLFFVIVFLLFIGGHPLISPDETRYTGIAWEMFHDNDYITPRLAESPFLGKPILFYWWDILAYNIFGVSDFASRFFPALIGAFACIMTFLYGRIVFSRRMGLLMSTLVAAAPLFFALTHYANMDGEVGSWVTCTLVSFLIAYHYIEKGRSATIWLYLAYFFAALAFLTKGLIGIVFPGMIIFFWILLLNDWRLLLKIRLVSGLILFLIVVTPWLYLCERANPGFLYYFFVFNQFYRYVGADFNNQQSFFYFWPIVVAGIFPFTLYILQAFGFHISNYRASLKQHKHSLFVMLWLFLVTLFFSIPGGKPVGHIAPAVPAMSMLMAFYFHSVWLDKPHILNKISSWAVVAIVSVVAVALLLLPLFSNNPHVIEATPYARFLAAVLLIGAALGAFWLVKKTAMAYLITTFICMTLIMNVTLIASLKTFNLQFNWPIAQKTLPYLKKYPNAEVVMMDQYYYSLPMYLDRNIDVVYDWAGVEKSESADGWPREIYDGVEYVKGHHKPETLLNYKEFKTLWNRKDADGVILITDIGPGERLDKLLGSTPAKQIGFVKRRGAYIYINQ